MIFGKQKMILICLFSLIPFNITLAEIPACTPQKKEALDKYGSEGSGKNLPFSSLSEDLKKKEKDKE